MIVLPLHLKGLIDKLESTIDYKSSHIATTHIVFVDKHLSTKNLFIVSFSLIVSPENYSQTDKIDQLLL